MDWKDLLRWSPVAGVIGLVVWQKVSRRLRDQKRRNSLPAPVTAYGIDEREKTVELGQVALSRGLDLLEERISFGGQYFESGEEAMAKTLIGYQRDPDHYIEINVITESLVTVRAGVGVTDEDYEEQVDLGDYDAVREVVRAYFNRARDFDVYWPGLEGRKRFP